MQVQLQSSITLELEAGMVVLPFLQMYAVLYYFKVGPDQQVIPPRLTIVLFRTVVQ